jgi:hypothetical protein
MYRTSPEPFLVVDKVLKFQFHEFEWREREMQEHFVGNFKVESWKRYMCEVVELLVLPVTA